MPLAIQTTEDLFESKRFKAATNNREYTTTEIDLIKHLTNHIGLRNIFNHYNMFTTLVSYDLTNLVERWEWLKNNKPRTTLESFVIRFGHTVGPNKYTEYGEKQRTSNSFEYKQKKFGWTKEQFDNYNKSRSMTLALCVKRHGTTKGQEIWDRYREQQRYTNSLEYYTEKYNEAGCTKWLEYNQEKAKSGKLEWVMEKFGVDHDTAVEIIASRYKSRYTSQAEQTFIEIFEKALGESVQYSVKNKQFCIWNFYLNTPCFYDMADAKRRKIIEFNSDYWHCNPNKYSADHILPHNGLTAKQVWERDYLKKKAALDKGYKIKIVWECDFQNNHEQVIKECVEWWNES
jgi:hypothetical protein